jgi:hypothetical protein
MTRYSHAQIEEAIREFQRSISPSLDMFVQMFREKLFRLEAQGDQEGIAAVVDLMQQLYILILESATTRKYQRIGESVVLPCERAIIKLTWRVINGPLERERAQ